MSSEISKIINFQYRSQAADQLDGVHNGPIGGDRLNINARNQGWKVVVHEYGITIQNVTTKQYATPLGDFDGAPVVGRDDPYYWNQVPVASGWYQFVTTEGTFVWYLTSGNDYAPIVLKPRSYRGQDAQWGYEPIARVE